MKKSFLIALLILACVADVQAMKKAKKKSTGNITYVSMHRSACFGRCPDYTIEIYNTGVVKYMGYMFVKDSGVYTKNIGQAKAMRILKQFETYRVDTCQKNYVQRIADLPGVYYVIRYKSGKEQEINNAHFGPEFLAELAKDIDKEIKVDASWKKLAAEAKR